MNLLKNISKAVFLSAAFIALPAFAQDKMVDALPVDKKLRALDSISIMRLRAKEQMEDAMLSNLYPSWSNNFVRYGKENMPNEYRIDLRGFHMPCDSRVVTSHFGYRPRFGRKHYGTDIKVYVGDTIRAAFNGKVRVVKYNAGGYGKYVIIRHPNGLETTYAHMSKQLVFENQFVKAGEPIGLGGSTGRSTGPHLHFETRFMGEIINPEELFSFEDRDVRADFFVYRLTGRNLLVNNVGGEADEEVLTDQAIAKAKESQKFQEDRRNRASRSQVYKVRRGDTLFSIARKYNTTVDRLCSLNNIPKNKKLSPGQIIKCS